MLQDVLGGLRPLLARHTTLWRALRPLQPLGPPKRSVCMSTNQNCNCRMCWGT